MHYRLIPQGTGYPPDGGNVIKLNEWLEHLVWCKQWQESRHYV